MNIFDIILGIIILFFFAIGIKKGLIGSIIQLSGLVLAVIFVGIFTPLVKTSLMNSFQFNPTLALFSAYFLIFIAVIILARIVQIAADKLINVLNLTIINRILGGLFNTFSCIIVFSLFILFFELTPLKSDLIKLKKDSKIIETSYFLTGIIKEELLEKRIFLK